MTLGGAFFKFCKSLLRLTVLKDLCCQQINFTNVGYRYHCPYTADNRRHGPCPADNRRHGTCPVDIGRGSCNTFLFFP